MKKFNALFMIPLAFAVVAAYVLVTLVGPAKAQQGSAQGASSPTAKSSSIISGPNTDKKVKKTRKKPKQDAPANAIRNIRS